LSTNVMTEIVEDGKIDDQSLDELLDILSTLSSEILMASLKKYIEFENAEKVLAKLKNYTKKSDFFQASITS